MTCGKEKENTEELSLREGRPVELEDGRIIRFSQKKEDFEQFLNGEWVDPPERVYWADLADVMFPPRWD